MMICWFIVNVRWERLAIIKSDLSSYYCSTHTNSRTILRTWMDFKMADTSERRVFCNTILFKYHDKLWYLMQINSVCTLWPLIVISFTCNALIYCNTECKNAENYVDPHKKIGYYDTLRDFLTVSSICI